jgi:fluoroacetyl-CoA thioesterase
MIDEIRPGLMREITHKVEEKHLASRWGSGLAEVLATPVIVGFCEECSRLAMEDLLPPEMGTVGSAINLRHLAPTPLGMNVTVKAQLVELDGRRLRFSVEAWDEVERIAEGEHDRFIIDNDRFERGVSEKARRLG